MKYPLIIFLIFILPSCSQQCDPNENQKDEFRDMDLSGFTEMVSPIRYNNLVKKAESGDINSITRLVGYYRQGGSKNVDFRNLIYWSEKQSKIIGPSSFGNVILFSADNALCAQAWEYLDKYFNNPKDFNFYSQTSNLEYINEKCYRPLKR